MESLANRRHERQTLTDLLPSITHKEGFDLRIQLQQKRLRLNLWPPVLEALKPVLEDFERQGAANVRIYLYYERHTSMFAEESDFEMELNEIIKNPRDDWMEDATKFIDSHPGIKDCHRYYLIRTDADCELDRAPDIDEQAALER
ncbi:hypothetical protein CFE70_005201 [Pyrenophora teres f. teres 0-1]|uniref:Uncharacterized protein n=2 Tax=Pyrenophora teres f. teres TaxID=97479 RepID=E3RPQ0_PYRTT|nr:hypothetical protein PTT_10638 [Pyrenophora teres f. teres 0-1]KAE8827678.1 hypothetical protein HRS9122_09659 [Pyrenophora teres f. teres]KAE8839282.1 hypothetical protein HRS9139_03665 [Pyrenophora teres f. teres]KAK1909647.1 hypothetical protein P3342_007819 [Pyrenophora teres f. teres]CAE7174673.1 hypothetical protein PTTW11_05673 [Pyrenophora teres f. teres]